MGRDLQLFSVVAITKATMGLRFSAQFNALQQRSIVNSTTLFFNVKINFEGSKRIFLTESLSGI